MKVFGGQPGFTLHTRVLFGYNAGYETNSQTNPQVSKAYYNSLCTSVPLPDSFEGSGSAVHRLYFKSLYRFEIKIKTSFFPL